MSDSSDLHSETSPADTDGLSMTPDFAAASKKVRDFPQTAGVYLMKDGAGRVIYVGKANNLRSRAGSYFLKAAEVDRRTADLVREIRDIDYLEADSEVDALLLESRLIKDVQPRFNSLLKDDKTFPYLQITTHEDFPRIEFTRSPASKGVKLYGPFPSAGSLRGAIVVLQRIFKFRTCSLDIDGDDPQWRWFRPCLLASIDQCTAPCNLRITKADYRKDINRLKTFLEGGKKRLLKEMHAEMVAASEGLEYEKAGRLRDEIRLLERLHERGDLEEHVQPEVFLVDPKKGLAGLEKVLGLSGTPRVIKVLILRIWPAMKQLPASFSLLTAFLLNQVTSDTELKRLTVLMTSKVFTKLSCEGSPDCYEKEHHFRIYFLLTVAKVNCLLRLMH